MLFQKYLVNEKDPKAAVFITGCSSGFGFDLARHLADSGMVVFAGVRKIEDAKPLMEGSAERAKRIWPIICDVTKQEQIDSAFSEMKSTLEKTGMTLHGLVNNAGMTFLMPVEAMPEDKLRQVWEVNYFGALNVTKKMLPLLRAAPRGRARIVFLGSCSPYGWSKFFGQYSQTKVSIELLADELRRELKPWDIKISVVEPGLFATKLQSHMGSTAAAFEQYVAGGSEESKVYDKTYRRFLANSSNPPLVPGNTFDKVSKSIEYCLRAKFPPSKRAIGVDAHIIHSMCWLLPDSAIDILSNYVL